MRNPYVVRNALPNFFAPSNILENEAVENFSREFLPNSSGNGLGSCGNSGILLKVDDFSRETRGILGS